LNKKKGKRGSKGQGGYSYPPLEPEYAPEVYETAPPIAPVMEQPPVIDEALPTYTEPAAVIVEEAQPLLVEQPAIEYVQAAPVVTEYDMQPYTVQPSYTSAAAAVPSYYGGAYPVQTVAAPSPIAYPTATSAYTTGTPLYGASYAAPTAYAGTTSYAAPVSYASPTTTPYAVAAPYTV
jgi:hypothetical protein